MSGNVDLYTHLDCYLSQCGPSHLKQDKNLDNHHNLRFVEDALKDVTVNVSFWGTRYVTKPNFRDSVNLRWLAYKVAEISVKYPPAVIPRDLVDVEQHEERCERVEPLCSTPERVAGRAVQQRVRQLFAESDEMLKNSFFARIFSAIREFFVYNTTRPSILGVNLFGDPLSVREAHHMCPTPTFTRGKTEEDGGINYCWSF